MSNLFSVFDPNVLWLNLNFNWVSSFLMMGWIPSMYWLSGTKNVFLMKSVSKTLASEFKLNFSPVNSPGHTHWAISLFLLILINNVGGLTPYTFTSTSHLSFSMTLALGTWLGYMIYSILLDSGSFLAHLVPVGTPYVLMPFMVLIELISNMIRPITLSVRLAANLVAGHLLMTLVSSPMVSMNYSGLIFLMSALYCLMILESAVAFIQAYVFSMLSTLYLSEVNNLKFNYL